MDFFYAKQRSEFEPGEAGVEAAKLEKFSAGVPEDASSLGWGAGGSQIQWLSEGSPKMHHLWGRAPADSHFLGESSIVLQNHIKYIHTLGNKQLEKLGLGIGGWLHLSASKFSLRGDLRGVSSRRKFNFGELPLPNSNFSSDLGIT